MKVGREPEIVERTNDGAKLFNQPLAPDEVVGVKKEKSSAVALPLWFRLLLEQRKNGIGLALEQGKKGTGLTLPFLIGAAQRHSTASLSADVAFDQLLCLLTEMRDSTPGSHRVRISRCTTLREPIAAIYESTDMIAAEEAIRGPSSARIALYVEDRYCPNRDRGLDSVLEYFWRECRHVLTHAHYSLNNKAYGPFTASDLEFIGRVG